jgi:DNA-binding GntR family transcriptional regulator
MKVPVKPKNNTLRSKQGRVNLSDKILKTLKSRILNWEYPPNNPLVEEDLSAEFGVSRSPVREALGMLEVLGLAERKKNRTFVVKQVHSDAVREIYELREALELYVVERLCGKAEGRAGLDALKKEWLDLSENTPDNIELDSENAALLDQSFHEGLAELLGNKAILENLRSLSERLLIFRTIDFQRPGRIEETCRQHLAIIDAIQDGDVAMARKCLLDNIEEGLENVNSGLQIALMQSHNT